MNLLRRMTRPQRHFVFGAVVVVLLLAVAIGVAFPNDGDSLTMRLPVGRAVVHLEDHRISFHGMTRWLKIVDGPAGRAYDVNPIGLMEAIMLIAGATALGVWSHRRLVRGLRLPRGRCDNCGYDMQGLENRSRCPECGDVEEPVDG
ncbi:MAG: hypothetical protein ACYTGR_02265 [Planctomycetota bacterium]